MPKGSRLRYWQDDVPVAGGDGAEDDGEEERAGDEARAGRGAVSDAASAGETLTAGRSQGEAGGEKTLTPKKTRKIRAPPKNSASVVSRRVE